MNNGAKYHDRYHIPLIYIPISSGAKDISDYREKYFEVSTRELLKELTR